MGRGRRKAVAASSMTCKRRRRRGREKDRKGGGGSGGRALFVILLIMARVVVMDSGVGGRGSLCMWCICGGVGRELSHRSWSRDRAWRCGDYSLRL